MAEKVIINKSILTDIGDAIREKESSSALIPSTLLASRIRALEAGTSGGGKVLITAEDKDSKIAVPNYGNVGVVYFDTTKSVEETNALLANLTFAPLYIVVGNATTDKGIVMMKAAAGTITDVDEYYIRFIVGTEKEIPIYFSSVEIASNVGYTIETAGWQRNNIEVNIDSVNTTVGAQNELIKDIIFIHDVYEKTLTGTYDGNPITVTELETINIDTFIDNKKIPLAIDFDIPTYGGESQGGTGIGSEGDVYLPLTFMVTGNEMWDISKLADSVSIIKNENVSLPQLYSIKIMDSTTQTVTVSDISQTDTIPTAAMLLSVSESEFERKCIYVIYDSSNLNQETGDGYIELFYIKLSDLELSSTTNTDIKYYKNDYFALVADFYRYELELPEDADYNAYRLYIRKHRLEINTVFSGDNDTVGEWDVYSTTDLDYGGDLSILVSDCYLSYYPTANSPIIYKKGGSLVNVSYDGKFAVPADNTTFVETINLNTTLTNDEVKAILDSHKDWIAVDDEVYQYIVFANQAATTTDGNATLIYIAKISDGSGGYDYALLCASGVNGETLETLLYQYSAGGWTADAVSVIEINDVSISEFSGFPIGANNDTLTDLIYIGGKESVNLSGAYDGTPITVTENSTVNLSEYIENKKLPLKVNIGKDPNAISWSDFLYYKKLPERLSIDFELVPHKIYKDVQVTSIIDDTPIGTFTNVEHPALGGILAFGYLMAGTNGAVSPFSSYDLRELKLFSITGLESNSLNGIPFLERLVLFITGKSTDLFSPNIKKDAFGGMYSLRELVIYFMEDTISDIDLTTLLSSCCFFNGTTYDSNSTGSTTVTVNGVKIELSTVVNPNKERSGILYINDELVETYKTNFPDYADQIKPYSEYVEG